MKFLLAGLLATPLLLGGVAQAQSLFEPQTDPNAGKQAGSVMVRLRAIGVLPTNMSSSTSIGGSVTATNQAAPELDLSYFFTDNFAVELIAASTRHNIAAADTALGHVDVGSAWVLPPTITAQWHFMPRAKLSPYVGAGVTIAFFYNTRGNEPLVDKFALSTTAGPAIQAGVDYNIDGHWFANFDVKQMFFQTNASISTAVGHVGARTWLNPTVIGAGIGYRF